MAEAPNPSHWYAALATELGVVVHVIEGDLDEIRSAFYEIRQNLMDPDLECISVQASRTNSHEDLWLVKRGQPNATQGELRAGEGEPEPSQGGL